MGFGPRGVRNFFVELECDGNKKTIRTGPHGKEGGFFLKVFIREGGQVSEANLKVFGKSDGETNTLVVRLSDGQMEKELVLATLRDGAVVPEELKTVMLGEEKEKSVIPTREAFWSMTEKPK